MSTTFTSLPTRIIGVSAIIVCAGALITAPAFAKGKGKEADWDQIPLTGSYTTKISDGHGGTINRVLEPACSGGPIAIENEDGDVVGSRPGNEDYSFFVKPGNPNRILIALDGGGACWNAQTCLGQAFTGDGTYTVEIDETEESLANSPGLFDSGNNANPYKNYTKVYVPYCSADIHWGSKDTTYTLPTLAGPFTQTIKHRGTDNVLSVLEWLKKNGRKTYGIDFNRARRITVTGLSAGGYGATLAFPYVADIAPRARLNLISDAAIGVQTDEFYAEAIYNVEGTESWGVKDNLPPFVPNLDEGFLSSTPPGIFTQSLFSILAEYAPDARLAALTHDFDAVQVFFFALQANLLTVDPSSGDVVPTQEAFGIWNARMKATTAASAQNGNYRFFIRKGFEHTFLANDEQTYDVKENGISVARWIRNMIKPGNRAWDNLGG